MNIDNFIFLIPARKGSKGIRDKNLVKIGNKELVTRTFETIKKIKYDRKYILTDDNRIKQLAKKYSINTSYFRKKSVSGDNVKLIETVKDFCSSISTKNQYKYVVILQPTSPLRTYKDIINSIKKFKKNKYSSLFSISPSLEHPNETIFIKNNKVQYFINQKETVRQLYKKSFFINGAIYISEKKNIFKNKFINKKNHGVYVMQKINSLDLDDAQDLELVKRFI
tara:strand:- start:742 stop:1413 length:672 start_codon:yes stop_codon:yes gene_type:complete